MQKKQGRGGGFMKSKKQQPNRVTAAPEENLGLPAPDAEDEGPYDPDRKKPYGSKQGRLA